MRDISTVEGFMLERYFRQKLSESQQYTQIGQFWDRKGGNEIDIVAINEIDGIIAYNKKEILDKTTDRIIEPTFDNIEEHLEFEPLSCTYLIKNNSSIGEETYKMFFNHREVVDYLQSINKQIMKMVVEGNSKDTILDLGLILGYSFYVEKFYEYWTEFFS